MIEGNLQYYNQKLKSLKKPDEIENNSSYETEEDRILEIRNCIVLIDKFSFYLEKTISNEKIKANYLNELQAIRKTYTKSLFNIRFKQAITPKKKIKKR